MRSRLPMVSGALMIVGLMFILGEPGYSQPKPEVLMRPESLYTSLRDVIDFGAKLFNDQGDYAGCYRLFQGALIATRPYIATNPALLKKVDDALLSADKQPRVADRAFALRGALDAVRDAYKPAKKSTEKIPEPAKKTKEEEPKKEVTKKEDVKKEEPKKEIAKKDDVKKEEPKKEIAKKDDVKKDEPKKEVAKKDDVKKDEPKKEVAKKEEPKKAKYSVVLESFDADKKGDVLKAVGSVTGLGENESKDLLDKLPRKIKDNVYKEVADKIKKQLEDSGAKVSLKKKAEKKAEPKKVEPKETGSLDATRQIFERVLIWQSVRTQAIVSPTMFAARRV